MNLKYVHTSSSSIYAALKFDILNSWSTNVLMAGNIWCKLSVSLLNIRISLLNIILNFMLALRGLTFLFYLTVLVSSILSMKFKVIWNNDIRLFHSDSNDWNEIYVKLRSFVEESFGIADFNATYIDEEDVCSLH